MKLDPMAISSALPSVEAVGGTEGKTRMALASGAYRAVMKSSPFSTLPKDKYDAWGEVIVNFDPELI